ncbi:MAG: hypothetical protein A2087_10305 [Spirochaetes bacterium GWD1_61_31]|nr:MAG: hypothetical protein A2Y37_12210 [Spirochaetes bacterium GWB1_60_80]OHD30138.1 MAG: hypothetical protein A2004_14070 [Spirochaetes bacterium GWC1_61_12]OHD34608.1 MAG: hypothetical protein A2087_10305 [Spirochaetes bacterium GWD1_61_31]OHD46424.1 MAG: hypothetical protein A2Y35_10210 [Spirochaetes bacterium GWE1_60_18]OHD59480.1 MAG: hypothetical protein A2Y32_10165 [Spirochaetes bacterium GWF1_60_12]HBO42097.1 hypothetical protein [Spirochaetaceae bacterium]
MQNKNPNGPDKALPSTEKDLEQYGVWVKAEPQDIVEEPDTEQATLDEIDTLDIDDIDLGAETMDDIMLSMDDESSLDSLPGHVTDDSEKSPEDYDELVIEDLAAEPASEVDTSSYDLPSQSDYELVPSLPADDTADLAIDDLSIDDLDRAEASESNDQFELAAFKDDLAPVAELEEDTDFLDSLDTPPPPSAQDKFTQPDLSHDDTIDIPLEDLDYDAPVVRSTAASEEYSPAPVASSNLDMDEISLDEFGLSGETEDGPEADSRASRSLKASGQNFTVEVDATDDFMPTVLGAADSDISLADTLDDGPDSGDKGEFLEPIDLDLHFDDTIPSLGDEKKSDEIDFNLDTIEDMSAANNSVSEAFNADDLLADVFEETPANLSSPPPRKVAASKGQDAGDDIMLDFSAPEKPDIPIPGQNRPKAAADERRSQPNTAPAVPSFNDLEALEKDLESDASPNPVTPEAVGEPASAKLLTQIANELSSIKSELMSLRSQLNAIKSTEAQPPASLGAGSGLVDAADGSDAAKGGFFDDEDDETIALTGDELDNILNTADFTEETLIEESVEDGADTMMAVSGDLLPEDGDYSSPTAGIETINLDGEEATESSTAANGLESDALEIVDGITPLAEAPEDTSYLEADIEAYPLDDTPLEEPDLSEISYDELLVEATAAEELASLTQAGATDKPDPSSDEQIEELEYLDNEGFADFDEEIAFEEDISLNIEAEEGLTGQLPIEPESIPELEDDFDLETEESSEITLHEEPALVRSSPADQPKPVEPVSIHPDELSMSLDDNLFVDNEASAIPAPVDAKENPAASPAPATPDLGIPAHPSVPDKLSHDVKSVLVYLDQLLSALPEDKIEEFAASEYYDTYKKLFEELGIL